MTSRPGRKQRLQERVAVLEQQLKDRTSERDAAEHRLKLIRDFITNSDVTWSRRTTGIRAAGGDAS